MVKFSLNKQCAFYFLIIFVQLFTSYSLDCTPSGTRDGIKIYEWKRIEFGVCRLPLRMPAIIQHTPLKQWYKSTKKRIIQTLSREGRPVTMEYHSSNCSCFDTSNKTLCEQYVRSFSSYKSGIEGVSGDRMSSIWYPYETAYHAHKTYTQCIDRELQFVPLIEAIKTAKSVSLNPNKVAAVSYPLPFKLVRGYRSNYVDFIKYKHIAPFFKVFEMHNGLEDILMMNNWVGSTGYMSTLHYDQSNNIYFMMQGNKTFELSKPDFYNKFVLFPMLHVHAATALYDARYIEHRVHVHEHEVFYLPSYWWHHVINGKYNSFALNVWIENYAVKKIESYQFPPHIRYKLADSIVFETWKEILYFVQVLQYRYLVNANDAFLFKYFVRMYPVLNDIHHHHMLLTAVHGDIEWMSWFVDIDDMLACYGYESERQLLQEVFGMADNLLSCDISGLDVYSEEWKQVIDDLLDILWEIEKEQGTQVAQIEMAEFVEKILYIMLDDTMFIPIFVALHFL